MLGGRGLRFPPAGGLPPDGVVEAVEPGPDRGERLLEQPVPKFLVLGVQPVDDLLAMGRPLVLTADLDGESGEAQAYLVQEGRLAARRLLLGRKRGGYGGIRGWGAIYSP
nr:hypothetical protein GCM10020093_111620 [Planobispora longispora]